MATAILVDGALTATLVVLVPAYQLWRSLTRGRRPAEPRIVRYRRALLMIGGLCAMLAVLWLVTDRPIASLGFDWPMSLPGKIGLAIAVVLVVAMGITTRRAKPSADSQANAAVHEMLPHGVIERRWYLAFAFGAGAGWEILYRGYLWWALTPIVGTAGAIAVMASSYGVAHGYNGLRPLIGALVSALIFAIAYALTHSLWWLIVIHTAFPLFALLIRPPSDALEK